MLRKEALKIFSSNLSKALDAKAWNQSDLARRTWSNKTRVASNGYTTVYGKDRISAWVAGKSLPSRKQLVLVAKALNMTPEDLLPSLPEREAVFAQRANSEPAAKFSVTPGAAGLVRVKFDMEVPVTSAAKLMELIVTTSCIA